MSIAATGKYEKPVLSNKDANIISDVDLSYSPNQ